MVIRIHVKVQTGPQIIHPAEQLKLLWHYFIGKNQIHFQHRRILVSDFIDRSSLIQRNFSWPESLENPWPSGERHYPFKKRNKIVVWGYVRQFNFGSYLFGGNNSTMMNDGSHNKNWCWRPRMISRRMRYSAVRRKVIIDGWERIKELRSIGNPELPSGNERKLQKCTVPYQNLTKI